MSYTRLGTIVLTDIASLRKAIEKNPALTWVEGATTYQHEYNARACVHKIKVVGRKEGAYEIGVIESEDGKGYQLVWDSSSGFDSVIGKGASIINTDYVREVHRDWAAKNGFTVAETVDAENNMVITMTNHNE